MSRKVKCPACLTEINANVLMRDRCWVCNRVQEEQQEEESFKSFMGLDEETRWRRLWEAAGKPEY